MNVSSHPEPGGVQPQHTPGEPIRPASSRSRLRLATVGAIAAIAILGGGIAAAASSTARVDGSSAVAAAETSPSLVTSRLVPTGTPPAGTATPCPAVPGASGGTESTGTPAPPAPKVHPPHLDGTVSSVSGSTVLIKDREGFTRTIVTSSRTTYQDGLTAALAVGKTIHAEGAVDANGTSLDATVIDADKGPAAGPGGPGPGGPAGKHDGPVTGPKGEAVPDGKAPVGAPTTPGAQPPAGTGRPTPRAYAVPALSTCAPATSAPATTK